VIRGRAAAIASLAALAASCAHRPPTFDPGRRPTCLVLSVGGADGVAHLGAIAAVTAAKVPISCVVGSSMGALIGALYAAEPHADTAGRFEALVKRYETATRREARTNGLRMALLFGAVAALLTDRPVPPLLAAGGGYLIGAGTTDRLDRDRLVRVMDEHFTGRAVEALPVSYAALHQRPDGRGGVTLVVARTGRLADAVGASVANPFLFPGMDVASVRALDPGADRAAATPVEEACRLFPQANILAVNVSGQPAFYSAAMTCPLREVTITPAHLPAEAVFAFGAEYQRAVDAGRAATAAALAAAR
jgi:predicted acylesterase/phospholipase RssA